MPRPISCCSTSTIPPLGDPLTSLIHQAADRAVRDVYVDGRLVVESGRALAIDLAEASHRLDAIRRHAAELTASRDHAGRPIEEVAPLPLPLRGVQLA